MKLESTGDGGRTSSGRNILRRPVDILISDKPRLCEIVLEVLPSAITLPRFAALQLHDFG
jgi:hypothetical protein